MDYYHFSYLHCEDRPPAGRGCRRGSREQSGGVLSGACLRPDATRVGDFARGFGVKSDLPDAREIGSEPDMQNLPRTNKKVFR